MNTVTATDAVLFDEDFTSPDVAGVLDDDSGKAWLEDGKLYIRNKGDAPRATAAVVAEERGTEGRGACRKLR